MEGGVIGGVWDGKRGMAIVPIWIVVGGGVCVERVLIASAMILRMCVVGGKEGRPNKLGM